MNELQIFKNSEFGEIRTIEKDGETWFVAKDVAEILGYTNPRKSIIDHVDEEDKTDGVTIRDSIGREQNPVCINESGIYSLIISSKLPTAKKFKRWVTSEVLPSIRKHGAYATPAKLEDMLNDPDTMIKTLQVLKSEQDKRIALEIKVEADKPHVAFSKAIEQAEDSILIGELSKHLKKNGKDIGQNRLFAWLRDHDYLMKQGRSKNLPTQKSMDLQLFEIKESILTNPDNTIRIVRTTLVTGKGQIYFVNLFLNEEVEEYHQLLLGE